MGVAHIHSWRPIARAWPISRRKTLSVLKTSPSPNPKPWSSKRTAGTPSQAQVSRPPVASGMRPTQALDTPVNAGDAVGEGRPGQGPGAEIHGEIRARPLPGEAHGHDLREEDRVDHDLGQR